MKHFFFSDLDSRSNCIKNEFDCVAIIIASSGTIILLKVIIEMSFSFLFTFFYSWLIKWHEVYSFEVGFKSDCICIIFSLTFFPQHSPD